MIYQETFMHLPISARFRAIRTALQERRSPEMPQLLEHLRLIEEENSNLRHQNEKAGEAAFAALAEILHQDAVIKGQKRLLDGIVAGDIVRKESAAC